MVHCDFVITLSVYDAMQINIVISRQNFANTFAETPNLNLEVCHIHLYLTAEKDVQVARKKGGGEEG